MSDCSKSMSSAPSVSSVTRSSRLAMSLDVVVIAVDDDACGVEARLRVCGPALNIPVLGVRPRDLTFLARAGRGGDVGSALAGPVITEDTAAAGMTVGMIGMFASAAGVVAWSRTGDEMTTGMGRVTGTAVGIFVGAVLPKGLEGGGMVVVAGSAAGMVGGAVVTEGLECGFKSVDDSAVGEDGR